MLFGRKNESVPVFFKLMLEFNPSDFVTDLLSMGARSERFILVGTKVPPLASIHTPVSVDSFSKIIVRDKISFVHLF